MNLVVSCRPGNLTSGKTFGDIYTGCHDGFGIPQVTLLDSAGAALSCDNESVVLANIYSASSTADKATPLIMGNSSIDLDNGNANAFSGPGYFTTTVVAGVASFPNITINPIQATTIAPGGDLKLDFFISTGAPSANLLTGSTRFQLIPGTAAALITRLQPDYGIGQVSVGLGENATSTVTIQDDGDAGTLGFTSRNVYVSEASSSVTLTVTRTGSFDPTWPIAIYTAVSSTIPSTASRGVDWQFTEKLIYFYGGKTSEEITIDLLDDALFEYPEEHFTLALVNGINSPGLHPTNRFCTVMILDDGDGGTFQFDPSTPTFSTVEQTNAQLSFEATILRSGRMNGEVTLRVESFDAISGPYNSSAGIMAGAAMAYGTPAASAKSNMGLTSRSDFVHVNKTVTFQTGESSKTITITVLDDDQFEIPEYFQVALTRATSNGFRIVRDGDNGGMAATSTNIGTSDYITVAIRDDGDAGTVSFASANYEFVEYYNETDPGSRAVMEGGRWSPSLSLVRSGRDTTFDMGINISTVGGAGSGFSQPATGDVDFLIETKTIYIAGNSTSSSFEVTILDDFVFEHPDESFLVVIDSVTNYPEVVYPSGNSSSNTSISNENITERLSVLAPESVGLTNKSRVVIVDDVDAGTFSFSSANYSVFEDRGTASLTVVRNKGDNGAVQVHYAIIAGTASGGDLQLETGTVTLESGVREVPITVQITQDDVFEYPDEYATVRLTGATCKFSLQGFVQKQIRLQTKSKMKDTRRTFTYSLLIFANKTNRRWAEHLRGTGLFVPEQNFAHNFRRWRCWTT